MKNKLTVPSELRVEVPDMLRARDGRALAQRKLLERFHKPLLFFTMNIPGPQKVSPLIRMGFEEGVRRLEEALAKAGIPILFQKVIDYKTGYEKYYVLGGAAGTVKEIAAQLENEDPLGRLFDMDVLDTDGRKLSREELGLPERRCFVCSEPAKGCARSRRHSLPVLIRNVERILNGFVLSHTRDEMEEALLGEVAATPKPGLVDLDNPGAHDDMDQETFKKSTEAILPHLLSMAETGWNFTGSGEELFRALRPMGAAAEKAMFRATGNVNTHKGIIFSLGTVSAFTLRALKRDHRVKGEAILKEVGETVTPILEEDFRKIDPYHPHTHGELLYVKEGCRGIRGEAMDGFPAVSSIGLPALRELFAEKTGTNEIYIETLLRLMAGVEDTNILSRSDRETLHYAQKAAQDILQKGGAFTEEGLAAVWKLNDDFVARHISPGGCADLLILSIFLYRMETLFKGPSA
ncbi:MAG: triphosphoribosyl-dephospho-CoA synthase CitG [Acidaminococcus sp.]|uniref:triphosphoribosyl-dephospho-CoA synthase CitG n=2 Tax=Acidaminococcus TaxID=904 RepID=UPI002A761B70|nr:triphosphoribosyl-dephospho-CoA synthase CitG [Acidaminococcus sp.]MDY2738688.1 triphosphoribosyl-dephospho-CoA synthase CitG [Acidaminococcus sp.]